MIILPAYVALAQFLPKLDHICKTIETNKSNWAKLEDEYAEKMEAEKKKSEAVKKSEKFYEKFIYLLYFK